MKESDERMKVSVKGEHVSDNVLRMYVSELIKAHPDKRISSVELIVEGDILKVRLLHDLEKTA